MPLSYTVFPQLLWLNFQMKMICLKTVSSRDSSPKNDEEKMSSFTHPHVVPNLYEFLSSVEHKRRDFKENRIQADDRSH